MAAQPTVAETIDYADLAIGYCANDNAKGALFGKRKTAPSSPVTQAIVTDALRWSYEGGATTAVELRQMANYLLWLINPYGITAQYVIDSGSGGGTVVPGTATRPDPLDFIVSASSVLPTGSTGATIAAFVGWNLQFDRGGITQNTTDVGDGSSYYGWLRASGTFSVSPALQVGELVRLTPV